MCEVAAKAEFLGVIGEDVYMGARRMMTPRLMGVWVNSPCMSMMEMF
jgi:hypothetical protein